jgi:hypothetical protein
MHCGCEHKRRKTVWQFLKKFKKLNYHNLTVPLLVIYPKELKAGEPGMLAHTCNPSIQEAEAGRLQGQGINACLYLYKYVKIYIKYIFHEMLLSFIKEILT